ncbi:MAG TPA: hypothetical protein VK726_22550 [Acetobacteraceae bacterium]|jgi:hypothetical protein|nr:hypothetical protein [Acetobacteraceae bacterium]
MDSYLDALRADGPAADRANAMDLYGWLIGDWALEVSEFLADNTTLTRPGEWHFGWVLEGRAIQDVWIVPPRGQRRPEAAVAGSERYGTTLRVYDPGIDAWHILWTEPVTQLYLRQIGRRQGAGIVQDGRLPDGQLMRWSFSDIAAHSFVWRSQVSADEGTNWRMNVEFLARRMNGGAAQSTARVRPIAF